MISVMMMPRARILTHDPPRNASMICPPATVPACARKISSPSSISTWHAVKGTAVTNGPMRPSLPKIRPMISVPAAAPMLKLDPPTGMAMCPMKIPRAIPRPMAIGLMSERPRAESPKNLVIRVIFEVGATTRTRSPCWRTRPGSPIRSTSPRRTREIVAEYS